MYFDKLKEEWNALGEKNPFWAILTYPKKHSAGWDKSEFFATGVEEIRSVMAYVAGLGIALDKERALDFGCGVGRLSQALAAHFNEVVGVDIAPSMITLADKYNDKGTKCRYVLIQDPSLAIFNDNSFNFIYSNIVLQHIEPQYSKRYIEEFIRIIAPKGVIIFQVPGNKLPPRTFKERVKYFIPAVILSLYTKMRHGGVMEMHCIGKEEVLELVKNNGAKTIDVVEDKASGEEFISYRYCITKE